MNKPLSKSAPINAKRFEKWLLHFSNYRTPVSRGLIEHWLEQFSLDDKDIAARVLDATLFINYAAIHSNYRELLNGVPGWNLNKSHRQGRWFFVPFTSSAGESGDSMLHYFRVANGMSSKLYDPLFIYRSELSSKKLTSDDTVILVDDFSGSGNQACEAWELFFREILIGSPRTILLLLAATDEAIDKIRDETEIEPHAFRLLNDDDNIFHSSCTYFSEEDKKALLSYCKIADNKSPKGFANTGALIVFAHRCPNNTIPILHSSNPSWSPIFPRF
jgi:hypothetical protein